MMPGLPNPWIMLGVVLALIGAFVAGNVHGHNAEKLVWQAAIEKQKDEAAQSLAAATEQVAVVQKQRDNLNLQIEASNAKHKSDLAAAAADNQRLAADIDRLRHQPGRGLGGQSPLPSTAGASAKPSGDPAPTDRLGQCEALLAEGSGLLSDVAGGSDAAALMAGSLKTWADGVSMGGK